ncbi:MAG: thiamine diphosphokinase [Rhizobiales bacterium]|nr:thiamine diphosphokinase [Hyphomicrobiales bacterium]MBI3673853.1 thiamine diphosphokinase [Hyphomicrobiales bacterium]
MAHFAILLGGNLTITSRLRKQIAGARVIAADSGIVHAAALGVTPELWVGDFDSSGSELAVQYRHIPRQTFSAEKDTTDGGLAIADALSKGARSVLLVGGFGGQADHMLGHFGQIIQLARAGIPARMTSGDEEAHPIIPGHTLIDLPAGTRLSLVPMTELVGLDLTGVRWPLQQRDIALGSTLTLSNIANGAVQVSLKSGHAVAIAYPR